MQLSSRTNLRFMKQDVEGGSDSGGATHFISVSYQNSFIISTELRCTSLLSATLYSAYPSPELANKRQP